MIFCAVLIWFSGYSIYNSENFQMIRIWQGKACLASVFLPLLLYLGCCIILEKQREYTWLLLLMADMSAFFHGDYSGMYHAGGSYGDGTGAVSKP